MVSVKPILFSEKMVRALLAGRKTQTRRVMKPAFRGSEIVNLKEGGASRNTCSGRFNDPMSWGYPWAEDGACDMAIGSWPELCPYYKALAWVRETWSGWEDQAGIRVRDREPGPDLVWHWADGDPSYGLWEKPRPSIHMPRWASRLTLRVTDIRAERVQDISDADVLAEGIFPYMHKRGDARTLHGDFARLWDSINAERGYGWDVNPWVWAISFEVIRRNVDDVVREAA